MAKVANNPEYTNHTAACLKTTFGDIPAYTFAMTAQDLLQLHYVAVRGKDKEEGAVQRPLSTRRINGIKTYILDGNTFLIRSLLIGLRKTTPQNIRRDQ